MSAARRRKEVEPNKAVAGERWRQVAYSDGKRMPKDMIARNKEMVVVSKASRDCQRGLWACLTHGQLFAQNFDKDSHLAKQREPCTLGWFCAEHGEVEEP